MKSSKRTKNIRAIYWTLYILSILLTVGPCLVYVCIGFAQAETVRKLQLGMCTVCAIILGAFNIVFKRHMRSVVWILMIGIYFALEHIAGLIIALAVCTIADEFLITPLKKSYGGKLVTNKEIDKRNE